MKLKSLLLSLLLMITTVAVAQVESGKAYRIVNTQYGTVIAESLTTHQLVCTTAGSNTDYQQMWMFEKQDDGRFFIKNVFTNRYVQNETGQNVLFKTGTAGVAFAIKSNETHSNYYNIDANDKAGGWGLHCDGSSNVVPWSYGPDKEDKTPSEWEFSVVDITSEEIANAPGEYEKFLATFSKIADIEAAAVAFFEDKACTVLKAEYAAMSDDALKASMEALPADLQAAVLKIKNGSWDTVTREQEFRVYDYKPYSNPEVWAKRLNLRPFNRINNPTGICTSSDREFLYVFVDKIPAGTTISLAQMQNTKYFGTDTELHVGLNVVPAAYKNGTVFVRYVCETQVGGKKLADYPTVKVHIEGGYVNGFWSEERGHTNEDWKYFQEKMFKNPDAIIAVGDLTMLDFRAAEFKRACPTNIEGVMAYWDFWNISQQKNMALDKYWDYFNNKQLAMSDDNGFMDAGNYRTHYNNNTLKEIVNYDIITADAGQAWGPNHEIGHTNQYAFQIVGTSEVSNNALANFAIFEVGTHTSRGNNLENQILDFENNVPYVARGEKKYGGKLFSMTRMYFQLYLYFHAAGKDKTFYPRLFEALREDPIIKYSTNECNRSICEDGEGAPLTNKEGYILGSMNAKDDQLKFIEKCCEVANMDLTEFFEAWGFFIPFKNLYVSDYGHYHVYLTQGAIDSCKAAIKEKNYPKKGGHLMFLEDRVRPTKKIASAVNSDVNGYRADYSWEVPVGTVGDYGQWEDYIDETVKAEGYYYVISNNEVSIMLADGAKGALGFKLYDEDGKLLTYTNRKKMKVPMSAMDKQLVVVAAQADGTDAVLKPASEGPEEMQLTALQKKLEEVKSALGVKSKDSNEIGYYRPAAIETLETLYAEAKNAYDNKDATAHSFAEWSIILDSELADVNSDDDNRILFEENMYAYFSNGAPVYSSYCLANSNSGLAGAMYTNAETDPKMGWTIEYAGKDGEYYIKDRNGYYVNKVELDQGVKANISSTALAEKFNILYKTDGTVVFTPVSNPAVAFGLKSQTEVVGMSPNDPAASWFGYVIKDNSADHYKEELEAAMEKAYFTITEVINFANINEMDFFNEVVVVHDRNLETYIMDLYNAYLKIREDKENTAMCKAYLTQLRKLFSKIDGTYSVKSPIVTTGEDVAIYRIVNKKDGKYLSILESTNSVKKNSLTTVEARYVDDNCLWSFATASRGAYNVYNHGKNAFVYKKPATSIYLYVDGNAVTPVAMSYDADENGVVLTIGDKPLLATSSSVKLGTATSNTVWELELVAIENNPEIGDIISVVEKVLVEADMNEDIYDLNGRKVLVPAKGIYIQNGKKVYVK